MLLIRLLCLFSLLFSETRATTHWMVTENGLIQPRIDSPFEMARPYDLLAFLNQDTRWDNINNLYHDLQIRKDVIQSLWNELVTDTDVNLHLAVDSNCLKAGPLSALNWYASVFEDGRSREISPEYFVIEEPKDRENIDVPDCKKISSLTFSLHTFEHLEGMVHRQNLSSDPELLPISSSLDLLPPMMAMKDYGHWLAGVLKKNSSSWLHYNMASIYWRVKGNAPKAMECSRRAVHYAPRDFKDVPLLGMGTILHRAKMTEDAVTVLGAAYDHSPNYQFNNFILANAYAVFGDYNNSLKHFDRCYRIEPTFDLSKKHKYGVLCHRMLLEKMQQVQGKLVKIREDLNEYAQREAHWLKSQASFLKTMYHDEKFDYSKVDKNCEKMSELTGLNIKELKKEGDTNSLIQYFLEGPMYNEDWFATNGIHTLESAYSLQKFIQHIEKHINMISDYVTAYTKPEDLIQSIHTKLRRDILTEELLETSRDQNFEDGQENMHRPTEKQKKSNVDNMQVYETRTPLYPTSMIVGRNTEDFDLDANWPSSKFCKGSAFKFPKDIEKVYPVFLPFENKGIRLQSLLSDKIGVPINIEHELPWHPPTCPTDKESGTISFKKTQKSQVASDAKATYYLRRQLLDYVGNGNVDAVKHMQDAEIGQRIYAAMQMKVAPKWMLYTISSLYWRVRGNYGNAINCLLTASKSVPMRHRDIVLTSIASVYLEIGLFEEALIIAEESFHLSLYEPATNFILAQMNMVKRHRNTQLYHLKQVVRVEPTFMGGFGRHLLNAWACATKFENEGHQEKDVCNQVDPSMSMVCDKDGSNCRVTNIECFNNNNRKEGSELLKMIKESDQLASHIDEGLLETLVEDMPDVANRLAHQENYARMLHSLDSLFKECGSKGCLNIQAVDIALKEIDCTYQHLQLGYWLNYIINFRQILVDADLSIPSEIITIASSSTNMIPECKLMLEPNDDIFLQRLGKINLDDWEPLLTLMKQVADVFDYFDYVNLGAKLSRYIEAHPRGWLGQLSAGWWCGGEGHAECCVHCMMAAYVNAPPEHARLILLSLIAITHMQTKLQDAKDIAYLMFYMSPKSKVEAFLVAVSHTLVDEHEHAIWMYRYALLLDDKFVPAYACLHTTVCLMFFSESAKKKIVPM